MREIKFRGKQGFEDKWLYGYLIKDKKKYYITNDYGDTFYEVITGTLGQFTGLYDKNNTPIYEGDIINNKNILEDTNYEVIFDNGAFYGKRKNYYNPETIMYLKLYRVDKEDIEVIGNIYDNEVEE